jgi:hypothetical protein
MTATLPLEKLLSLALVSILFLAFCYSPVPRYNLGLSYFPSQLWTQLLLQVVSVPFNWKMIFRNQGLGEGCACWC